MSYLDGNVNPIRYRGYYYDDELGLYYLRARYYDPETGRFISQDSIDYVAPEHLMGLNLYAYCGNNPISRRDPVGTEWWNPFSWDWEGAWNNVKTFCSNTFGAGVVQAHAYKEMSVGTFFGGAESGIYASEVIVGDISKPVSFYAVNASKWWRFWEYKVGLQINIDDGGFAVGFGLGEASIEFSNGTSSTEVMVGLDKFGYTVKQGVTFDQKTATQYYHEYIRTLPIVGMAILIYLTKGAIIPAIVGVGAGA